MCEAQEADDGEDFWAALGQVEGGNVSLTLSFSLYMCTLYITCVYINCTCIESLMQYVRQN